MTTLGLLRSGLLTGVVMGCCVWGIARADEPMTPESDTSGNSSTDKESSPVANEAPGAAKAATPAQPTASPAPKPKFPPASEVLKDFKPIDGVIKLYRKENRVLAEIPPAQMNRDFLVLISIARGIGEGRLLGGMSWGFGDDWLWQFRRVDDSVHVVRRNVRFRASKGTPEERAVEYAYTDSVLFAVPILTMGPSGGVVIDLSQIFMTDLPQFSRSLPGFVFSPAKSTWAMTKGFKDNVELQIAATYASGGQADLETVADSRGVSLNIHYSISTLPETGYQPRMADDRVGYFMTVAKDYSKKGDEDRFVRFINRWDLQKADPKAEISPPKRPIVFWIENTVPYEYRSTVREGILEWNKAFEKAGFSNAIEVRQQPDNADWEPEDVNYNTFRWITASAGFAMGPSRVNPKTGQILDADIIFDADFVQYWKREYETFTPEKVAALTGGPLDIESYQSEQERLPESHRHSLLCRCELHTGMARELAFGATALMARDPKMAEAEQKKLITQALKEVVMHEVGHTLGLRHNFKGSTMLTLAEMNDTAKAGGRLSSSVMDYTPANMMPRGETQGDYYSTTIGPYDMWAIEYGYTPLSGGPEGEQERLRKIASRGAEPGHNFATDEDTRGIDSDPYSNRFDLGKDPLEYARSRTKLVSQLIPDVVERAGKEGEGYQRVRQAFGVLLGNYGSAAFFASRFVGGVEVNRDHLGDPNGRAPYVIIPADKQRDALKLTCELVLSDRPFDFPPELYNHLAATHWNHWGVNYPPRSDYAVHEVIAMWQRRVLSQLLSPLVLSRLHDSELKIPADQDAFTTAELFDVLSQHIFAELDNLKEGEYTNRQPAISSLRRNLQRLYAKRLSDIVLMPASGSTSGVRLGTPEDCQSVAYLQLVELKKKIDAMGTDKLDPYTQAHLIETSERIGKTLESRMIMMQP